MRKLLIASALLATAGLASANTTEATKPTVSTDYDAFYSIEDYNDPLYGNVYERKIDEQTPVLRFGK